MALFQKSVLKKHLNDLNKTEVSSAYKRFVAHFGSAQIQENIRDAKEEEYQEGFVRDLFVQVLGYTLKPQPHYNFVLEKKNEKDSKKADGAVVKNETVHAVIELKGTDTVDLDLVEQQAFGYKNNQKGCRYVVISNFEKLRFYIDDSVEHIEFDLFTLDEEQFQLLYLCLQKDNFLNNVPLNIKEASVNQEKDVTKKLYNDYSNFKRQLYQSICALNPQYDKPLLYRKTQKLLDRFLFILFAEDKQLLPPNSIRDILKKWESLKELDAEEPLYVRYKKFFGYMNTGREKPHDIFAYNGGLFAPDEVLDNIQVDDTLLYNSTFALSQYDFETEVDVNILGHIFEHSLNDVDAVTAEAEGKQLEKDKTRRKKDGVFYTPKYITKYIVENTVGKLCTEKKAELKIKDDDYSGSKKRKDQKRPLVAKLEHYRNWLLQLTILDPACGSGAFLNQALEFLIAEHYKIDELLSKLTGATIILSEYENHVLENNLYGVDLNEESIEIAKLSLWLRTAKKGRKLSALNNNIKCGNSLIDDPAVAGDKAFNWQQQFADVFAKGGFDVVIGNPPYVRPRTMSEDERVFLTSTYTTATNQFDLYHLFIERLEFLVAKTGLCSYIVPNAYLSNENCSKLRLFILSNFSVEAIVDCKQKIFDDANVESSVFCFSKNGKTSLGILLELSGNQIHFKHLFDFNKFRDNTNHNFTVTINTGSSNIFAKIRQATGLLADYFDVMGGIKEYQVGKGKPPQTQQMKDDSVFNSTTKRDDTYIPEIRGKHLMRYGLKWESEYVSYGPWLAEPRDVKYFVGEKVMIRQIPGPQSLVCSYTKDDYIVDQSAYVVKQKAEANISYKCLLCIVNSKLLFWFFRAENNEFDDLFPKIKSKEIKALPIKEVNANIQLLFESKADQILSFTKQLQTIQSQFLQLLQSKVALDKVSNKLQEWYMLEFKEFLAELKKAKTKLSLTEEAEWMNYFNEQRAKALTLKAEIDKTDKEIDQLVYKLYELTPEEIKIVEGGNN